MFSLVWIALIAAASTSARPPSTSTRAQPHRQTALTQRSYVDDVDSTDTANSARNYVFAHFIQGNAQSYTKDDWVADMTSAQNAHIDAFAINIGTDPTNAVQLPLLYDVADSLNFKVFLSFDMSYYGYGGSSGDIERTIKQFANRTSQFKYDGRVFVSTFSGEVPGTYLDGNANYPTTWCSLKASLRGHGVDVSSSRSSFSYFPARMLIQPFTMERNKQIYLLPGWTGVKPSVTRCADGLLSWDAWPPHSDLIMGNSTSTHDNITSQENLYFPDTAFIASAEAMGKSFASPVSPLFFKHLGDSPGDNLIYRSDDWMMINRYTKLIQLETKPQFIELLTWNDYGESHYLSDPRPSANLPQGAVSAHQYVDGFPHTPLLNLTSYFNQWYKTGTPPVMNQRTTVYVWYRPHLKNAIAYNDTLPIPAFSNLTEDRIYAYLIPSPDTNVTSIRILSGPQVLEQVLFPLDDASASTSPDLCRMYEDVSNDNEAEVDGDGILLSAPFQPGSQFIELLDKKGRTLASLQGLEIEECPQTYNFNYWTGSLSA
ncbi:family 71 glycoside hydrolase [Melampsora larici-populina 98AG31]|uniref:Family 71 glycoside hydrolase n=1 Tax=Melampsora larici-populina (strain 98AG31 / pathotype 3-4-7) TaxID=747676 RepID=F4R8T3_MELLP|nr:family 71 glycoside hydrolase [Melampsora larici-populina 98AG31]EGG10863.1 family 71 glycoside hydrolase [Melampsora larici-populina 98AG31]